MLFNLVFGQDMHLISSIKTINNTFREMEIFCKGKISENFCSTEHLELVAGNLRKQLEIIQIKMEKDKKEARRAEKLRQKQRLYGERMDWMLREHFLDRHI